MESVLRVLAVMAGIVLTLAALASAIKTVILPRAVGSLVTRWVFLSVRVVFRMLARPSHSYEWRDRVLSFYAPLGLISILATWLVMVFAGYGLVFWGLEGTIGVSEALELSGSSLLTLGFVRPETFWLMMVSFSEAAIGLFLLALLITYLPSMYGAFSRREVGVTALAVRAGEPPSGRELIWRFWTLQRVDELHDVWTEWERWFVDIEETHTSLPALAFFRSPNPDHSWTTAAGAVLDGASLADSVVDIDHDVQADICIRAGYLCLRRIADFFQVPYDPDPAPDDPISITRQEWDAAIDSLAENGVPIKTDRDQGWRDFAGWRVNYDTVLLALANITSAPYAPWSSDRSGDRTYRQRLLRRRRPARVGNSEESFRAGLEDHVGHHDDQDHQVDT